MSTPSVTVSGRCSSCGDRVESTAGCSACWLKSISEAAQSTIELEDLPIYVKPSVIVVEPKIEVNQHVFSSLLFEHVGQGSIFEGLES